MFLIKHHRIIAAKTAAMVTDAALGNVDQLYMAYTIVNKVVVAVMNNMMAKLDMQDIAGMKDMADMVEVVDMAYKYFRRLTSCQNPNWTIHDFFCKKKYMTYFC